MRLLPTFAAVLLLLPGVAEAERQLVLVTAAKCGTDRIRMLDVRKAYMGIGVVLHDHLVQPYRLLGDELMEQIFFQNIVAMSHKSYDRRMLSMRLKYGIPRVREFDTVGAMVASLRNRTCSIGYLWRRDAVSFSDLKLLTVLWKES